MKIDLKQREVLLGKLEKRFLGNMKRHQGLKWSNVKDKLLAKTNKLQCLFKIEKTGGEPDVIGFDSITKEFVFCDCSIESPNGRRNLCYDSSAQESRKSFKPKGNAVDTASEMGATLLNESQYRELQKLGKFDTKTSSWINTPTAIRKLGGALFADRRYDNVFIYHNSAPSYYSSRGFRCLLKV